MLENWGSWVMKSPTDWWKPIRKIPSPKDLNSKRRVVGLFSYYSNWIHNFLDEVHRQFYNGSLSLSDNVKASFLALEKELQGAVATSVDPKISLVVETDGSDITVSATLSELTTSRILPQDTIESETPFFCRERSHRYRRSYKEMQTLSLPIRSRLLSYLILENTEKSRTTIFRGGESNCEVTALALSADRVIIMQRPTHYPEASVWQPSLWNHWRNCTTYCATRVLSACCILWETKTSCTSSMI